MSNPDHSSGHRVSRSDPWRSSVHYFSVNCPPSLPIYGAYFVIQAFAPNNLAKAFLRLGRRYKTDIVGCFLAAIPSVIVNDPVLIKEVLNREEFDGRMDIILGRLRSYWKRLGIFFTDGYFWHTQRRFTLRYMRDYGFGRRCEPLEEAVTQEIRQMLDMRLNGPQNDDERWDVGWGHDDVTKIQRFIERMNCETYTSS
ncbi:probable cytochrome P450 304a1 [Choristoneura fumiferana]|uniref:probable cytochrome P450 304a1 n=1 Tax=Choristoneura fumiferana TaxID=7141 RepID=UPI003D157739